MKPSLTLADEMMAHQEKMVAEVMENREEILRAFIAKYGFDPDECEQITYGNSWRVVRVDPALNARIQRAVILGRLKRKRFSWWQQLCLAMAGVGK